MSSFVLRSLTSQIRNIGSDMGKKFKGSLRKSNDFYWSNISARFRCYVIECYRCTKYFYIPY